MSADRICFPQMAHVPGLTVPPGKVLLDLTKDELLFIGVAIKLLPNRDHDPMFEQHIISAFETFR